MALRIDRTTFLALTFGMAGCNTGPGPAVAATVIEIPKQPAQAADGGAVPPQAASPEENVEDDDVGAPEDEGEDDAAFAEASTCGWVDPRTVTRPKGTCDDAQGVAPSCAGVRSCAGFSFPQERCESFRRNFKPQAAKRAIDCLGKLTKQEICDDACNTYRCGDRALKASCPDPTADPLCALVTSRCRTVAMDECKAYFSALNANGRGKAMRCIIANCGLGLFSCMEGL